MKPFKVNPVKKSRKSKKSFIEVTVNVQLNLIGQIALWIMKVVVNVGAFIITKFGLRTEVKVSVFLFL